MVLHNKGIKCECCNTHSDLIYVSPRCHPNSEVKVVLVVSKNQVVVLCKECDEIVCNFETKANMFEALKQNLQKQ